jgi:hypothetical protein
MTDDHRPDQAYYWAPAWQAAEAEALAALAAGQSRTFANAAEAVAWLQEDECEPDKEA